MTESQCTIQVIDAATKAQNAWAKFATVELETKLADLQKLVESGMLTVRSLEHQFTEIAIIENEFAGRDGE